MSVNLAFTANYLFAVQGLCSSTCIKLSQPFMRGGILSRLARLGYREAVTIE